MIDEKILRILINSFSIFVWATIDTKFIWYFVLLMLNLQNCKYYIIITLNVPTIYKIYSIACAVILSDNQRWYSSITQYLQTAFWMITFCTFSVVYNWRWMEDVLTSLNAHNKARAACLPISSLTSDTFKINHHFINNDITMTYLMFCGRTVHCKTKINKWYRFGCK